MLRPEYFPIKILQILNIPPAGGTEPHRGGGIVVFIYVVREPRHGGLRIRILGPYVFGPPGYGSFYQAKIVRKALIPTVL